MFSITVFAETRETSVSYTHLPFRKDKASTAARDTVHTYHESGHDDCHCSEEFISWNFILPWHIPFPRKLLVTLMSRLAVSSESKRIPTFSLFSYFLQGRCQLSWFPARRNQLRLRCPYQWMGRSEEHTSELQSRIRISYAVFCLKKSVQTSRLAGFCALRSQIMYSMLSPV